MIGCSSDTIGRSSLASSTSEGRVTVIAFRLDEDPEGVVGFWRCSAKAVFGNCRSSPKGPRISLGPSGCSFFRFLGNGGGFSEISGGCSGV